MVVSLYSPSFEHLGMAVVHPIGNLHSKTGELRFYSNSNSDNSNNSEGHRKGLESVYFWNSGFQKYCDKIPTQFEGHQHLEGATKPKSTTGFLSNILHSGRYNWSVLHQLLTKDALMTMCVNDFQSLEGTESLDAPYLYSGGVQFWHDAK